MDFRPNVYFGMFFLSFCSLQMPSLSLLRKRLRLRGLRLHLVYCRSVSSLLVLPLHASRAQALR